MFTLYAVFSNLFCFHTVSAFLNVSAISLNKYMSGKSQFASKEQCFKDWVQKCSHIIGDDGSIPNRVSYDSPCGPLCRRDISGPILKMCRDLVNNANIS